MNILLLCDRKGADNAMLNGMQDILGSTGCEYQTVILNHDELKPCTGCFGCWVKTPGQCVITSDGANSIASKLINADAVAVLSEVTYGGFSSDIKTFLDRSIQNILPFFETYKGEMHHPMRYERFPIWLAIGYGDVSGAEKQTFITLADRNALNKRPPRYLSLVVKDGAELGLEEKNIMKTLGVGV